MPSVDTLTWRDSLGLLKTEADRFNELARDIPPEDATSVTNSISRVENRLWRTRRDIEAAHLASSDVLGEALAAYATAYEGDVVWGATLAALLDLHDRGVLTVDYYRLKRALQDVGQDWPIQQEGTTT